MRRTTSALALASLSLFPVILGAQPAETLSAPGFGRISLYAPAGPPRSVVLFLSGDGGWNLGVVSMAERLRSQGALVVGIDVRSFVRELEASPGCAYPAGPLEDLSREIQLRRKLPAYLPPILVGYSSGATLAYAAVAAAPPETFSGAISLGFCPDLEMRVAPCRMRGLEAKPKAKGAGFVLAPFAGLTVPWMVLQGEIDQVCDPAGTRAFVAATGSARVFSLPRVGHGFSVPRNWEPQLVEAYEAVAKEASASEVAPKPSIPEIEDLPLVEVPAAGGRGRGLMAVLLTGDGGWAEIDKTIAAGLAAAGVPTVGWNSLRYYWSPRTPEGAAKDLSRILDHYCKAWSAPEVLLVGYSFGADVLPFLVTRLPDESRARVRKVALVGPSADASFEFHLSDWLGGSRARTYPTVPEVERLDAPVICVQGSDEVESPCGSLKGSRVVTVRIGRGHHFSGEYDRLLEAILRR